MIAKTKHILFLLFITTYAFAQDGIRFKTEVPLTVTTGTNFQVAFVLQNAKGTNFHLDEDFDKLNLYYGPSISQSSSTTIINGQRSSSSSISYVYTVSAPEEGIYDIPTASIEVDGKVYTTKKLQVKALASNQPANQGGRQNQSQGRGSQPNATERAKSKDGQLSPEDLFVKIILTKNKVYEQEAVVATFKLFSLVDVTSLTDAEFPEFKGFITQDIELPSNRQFKHETYNGKNYYTIDLKKTLLFPQQTGELSIPEGSLTLVAQVPSGKYYQDFFGIIELKEKVEKKLKTGTTTIDVMSLPEGKPLNFSNGVGNFNLKTNVSKKKVKANESITYTIEEKGIGNLKLLKTPKINFPKEFEVFDPKITNDFKTSIQGLAGKRTIEYTIIPRIPGTYEIPEFNFSYFDPESKSYKTLTAAPIKLDIEIDPNVDNSQTQDVYMSEDHSSNEIKYINTANPHFKNYLDLHWGNFWYIIIYSSAILLLILWFIVSNYLIEKSKDTDGIRIRKANKMAIRRLKVAKKYLAKDDKDKFYEECTKAIWGYLSDKLNIPLGELNRATIQSTLNDRGVSESLIDSLIQKLNECDFERYSPTSGNLVMKSFYESMIDQIINMDKELGKL